MKPLETILRRLASRLTPGGSAATAAVQAGAAALQLAVERHYRHTSQGGFRKAHVSKGQVSLTTTPTTASVNINSKELAHLILGGRVVPVPPRKAPAIPLTPEARAAALEALSRNPSWTNSPASSSATD